MKVSLNKLMYALAFGMLLASCGSKEQETEEVEITEQEATANSSSDAVQKIPNAVGLMKGNCFTCHVPRGSESARNAPPMYAVKKHYMEGDPTKEEFVSSMLGFLQNPTEEKSKMPGAVEKFGLMPNMGYSEKQIKTIATYLYDNSLEKPDWFDKHYEKEHGKQGQAKGYKAQGKEFALQTKAILGKNLMGAIKDKGTLHALEFCNTRAYPLTDSMATALQAHIKRVSDQPRNPKNEANEVEMGYIQQMKEAIAQGGSPQAYIQKNADQVTGYYPIMTNGMCLQCHGDNKQAIKPEVSEKIAQLYPNDKATGYAANQLRGIWVVEMNK